MNYLQAVSAMLPSVRVLTILTLYRNYSCLRFARAPWREGEGELGEEQTMFEDTRTSIRRTSIRTESRAGSCVTRTYGSGLVEAICGDRHHVPRQSPPDKLRFRLYACEACIPTSLYKSLSRSGCARIISGGCR